MRTPANAYLWRVCLFYKCTKFKKWIYNCLHIYYTFNIVMFLAGIPKFRNPWLFNVRQYILFCLRRVWTLFKMYNGGQFKTSVPGFTRFGLLTPLATGCFSTKIRFYGEGPPPTVELEALTLKVQYYIDWATPVWRNFYISVKIPVIHVPWILYNHKQDMVSDVLTLV